MLGKYKYRNTVSNNTTRFFVNTSSASCLISASMMQDSEYDVGIGAHVTIAATLSLRILGLCLKEDILPKLTNLYIYIYIYIYIAAVRLSGSAVDFSTDVA